MTETDVAAIVLTHNEERHLSDCLQSIAALTINMIVVDSGSVDGTLDIARRAGAQVVHRPFKGFAAQRNAALALDTGCGWTLFVDADERLTPDLVDEIRSSIANAPDDVAGLLLPRKNQVCGRTLSGGGWWPDYQARVIRRGRGTYDEARQVHEIVRFKGRTKTLTRPLIHINYESWGEVLRQQRAYTLRLANSGLIPQPKPISYLSRPLREFWRRFVQLGGYRDGTTGLIMACVMGLEELRGCVLARRRASR